MRLIPAIAVLVLAHASLAHADPSMQRLQLLSLPHADISRLIGF